MHFCAPPKFRILVAGIVSPSDPSRGIPATIARTGFELQQIVLPNGQTMAEHAQPLIARAYETGDMPPLLPHLQ